MRIWEYVRSGFAASLFVTSTAFCSECAVAQLVPIPDTAIDRNLGTVIRPDTPQTDLVTGGTQRGQNLFHSFQEFNVQAGRGVYFENPAGVRNILSRVTGANRSDIEGTLGVLGTANLFLINPNGILFGPNASLDLRGGSFYGTTASGVKFGDLGEFSATNPQPPSPLLTINPSAFFFTTQTPGSITNQSQATRTVSGATTSGLQVRSRQNLLLLGGDVTVDGGRMNAWGGRIEISAIAAPGTVELNGDGSLTIPATVARADVVFDRANLDVSLSNAGNLAVAGRNITLKNGSVLRAGIDAGLGTPESRAGELTLNATAETRLEQGSRVRNVVSAGLTGQSGNVNIKTESLVVTGNSQLSSSNLGTGNSGNVVITANRVLFDNGRVFSSMEGVEGNAGNVQISANTLEVINGGQLIATTDGIGDAGNVIIDVRDLVLFSGISPDGELNSTAFSRVNPEGKGKGGNVQISTNILEVTNGARLNASTRGTGDAGNVLINARDRVLFDNGRALSSVEEGAKGNAGNVNITTGSLTVRGDARLSSSTSGKGNAGNVIIDANQVLFDYGFAFSSVNQGAEGQGGNVQISANTLEVINGGQLIAITEGIGDAGNVIINARDRVLFSGAGSDGLRSAAFSRVNPNGEGKGGNVQISTNTLEVTNGARLNASTQGTGNAGNVLINARDSVLFDNGRALSSVEKGAKGNAGNVNIVTTGSLTIRGDARLSSSTFGKGNAGNVIIDANRVLFDNGFAFSSVNQGAEGQGGNVQISANTLDVINGGQLIAITEGIGDAGNVIINARDHVLFSGIGSDGLRSGAFSRVNPEGRGNGGNVQISTNSLEVTNGARLISSTQGTGNAGNVIIDASTLEVTNNGRLLANTEGTGDAGNVLINARDSVLFDNGRALSSVEEGAKGNAGNVNVTTGSLTIRGDARLSSSTSGKGNAGNVIIDANRVLFDYGFAFSSVEQGAEGQGGNVQISANTLEVINGGQLIATTDGIGNAGNVLINARDRVLFRGSSPDGELNSTAFSRVNPEGRGNGGNVQISTNILEVTNDARLNASTLGNGDAGNVLINANDIVFDNGYVFSSVEQGATGNGGNVQISTNTLEVTNGAQLVANTRGRGNAGNVVIEATNLVKVVGTDAVTGYSSGIFTSTSSASQGGNITVNAPTLQLVNGAVIDARTFAGGYGGDVTINAATVNLLNGGQLLASSEGSGRAGSISVTATNQLTISGTDPTFAARLATFGTRVAPVDTFSGIFVGSKASGGAGDITITSPRIRLDQGRIIAESAALDGGNITVNMNAEDILRLRHGSLISASAGAGGNGGNITINAPNGFIVAVPKENSDITANAITGSGGRVDITAQGVYGIRSSDRPTPLSDITASSESGVSGTVNLDIPNIDPSRGLGELPVDLPDATTIITQRCLANRQRSRSSFTIIGRGGLQVRPGDTPLPDYATGTIRTITPPTSPPPSPTSPPPSPSSSSPSPIIEAQGWNQDSDGNLWLVAQVPTSAPSDFWLTAPECR